MNDDAALQEFLQEEFRKNVLPSAEDADPDLFPALGCTSARVLFTVLPIPTGERPLTEYVRIRTTLPERSREWFNIRYFCVMWNLLWESGELRQLGFPEEFPFPAELAWLQRQKGRNFTLVFNSDYEEYEPLFHLLPARNLQAAGLPLVQHGSWQHAWDYKRKWLPLNLTERLSRAVGSYLWPLLYPRPQSPISAFAPGDSLRLLAHNLDFWLPYLDAAIREHMFSSMPLTKTDAQVRRALRRAKSGKGFRYSQPRMGGAIWMGEAEAESFARRMVELADGPGRLRGVFEALESHREADDFSSRWSVAKAEFERTMHHKRNKTKVTFVELANTVPIHAPEAETENSMFFQDLMTLVKPKERRVLVLLRSGHTQAEIAQELGYSGHSPVSKMLRRIARRAAAMME